MDSEGKFWLGFWSIAGLVVLVGAYILITAVTEAGIRVGKRASLCIENGGTWVGIADTCIAEAK